MAAESLHTRCQGGVWLLNLCILGAKGGVLGETVRPLTPGRFEACARNGLSSKKTCIPTHSIFGAGAKRGRMNSATVAPWGPGAGSKTRRPTRCPRDSVLPWHRQGPWAGGSAYHLHRVLYFIKELKHAESRLFADTTRYRETCTSKLQGSDPLASPRLDHRSVR